MTVPSLGVVIVSFNSSDVILDCLESLLAAPGVRLQVVVVDNASTDGTPALLEAWAAGRQPYLAPDDLPFALTPVAKPLQLDSGDSPAADGPCLTLLRAPVNGGFAAGVNLGLAHLARQPGIDRFWVLNPDSVVPPETPRIFATQQVPGGRFSLMGGRVTYLDPPDRVQIDGGTLNRRTGVTGNLNLGRSITDTAAPDAAAMDFITGASMVVSRAFYEAAGPMAEDYFLYYEEVDWAMRRGDLPLAICPGARVYHRAGTAIGSPTLGRIASAFSIYFKHRGRMRFMRRFHPGALPVAWAYSLAKAGQYALKGHRAEAAALLAGSRDAPPPAAVRDRLSPEAARLAFAPPARS
jgi:GT2 family glycosyltransferase